MQEKLNRAIELLNKIPKCNSIDCRECKIFFNDAQQLLRELQGGVWLNEECAKGLVEVLQALRRSLSWRMTKHDEYVFDKGTKHYIKVLSPEPKESEADDGNST